MTMTEFLHEGVAGEKPTKTELLTSISKFFKSKHLFSKSFSNAASKQ